MYIKNRHGVYHEIPEELWPLAERQGATKATKKDFDSQGAAAREAKVKRLRKEIERKRANADLLQGLQAEVSTEGGEKKSSTEKAAASKTKA